LISIAWFGGKEAILFKDQVGKKVFDRTAALAEKAGFSSSSD
jgi:hypothetical protein